MITTPPLQQIRSQIRINENKIKLSVDDAKMVSFVPMACVSEKSKSITEKKLRKFSVIPHNTAIVST